MVADAAGDQFAAETRLVIHLKHVDAGMRDAGFNQNCNGLLPGGEGLARKAGDQVDIEVGNPARSEGA